MNDKISAAQLAYINEKKRQQSIVALIRVAILAFFFLQWEITARLGLVDSFLFSSPGRVFRTILDLSEDLFLAKQIGITLTETVASFAVVSVLTVAISVLLWFSESVSKVLEPYLVVLNSIPKSALAPLFIVWFGANQKTIIITGITLAIFGSVLSLYTAFMETDPEKYKLIYTLGGNRRQVLQKIILPSSLPVMVNLMKVNIGLCLVGVIIGEFMAAKSGLGYLIIYGSQVFKMDWVITSLLLLCGIAIIFYKGISVIEKHMKKC